jgi:hypothetical protein
MKGNNSHFNSTQNAIASAITNASPAPVYLGLPQN